MAVVSAMLCAALVARGQERDQTPAGLAFRVAKVVSMDENDTIINNAVVLVADGKITAVGRAADVTIPDGYRVIDARERWLTPGLIDCHDHSAASGGDINDGVYLTNPGLDTIYAVEPDNAAIKRARTGGVTCVLLIPGSGTNMSGFGTICKTAGKTQEEVVVRSPGSLKIAQAGNPERYWSRVARSFMYWNTRQTLEKARDYYLKWKAYEDGETTEEPEFDPHYDALRGLMAREYPVTVHTQGYQLMMTTLDMLIGRFKLWVVLDHCTFDGWKVGPLVVNTDAWTINGPRQFRFDRTQNKMIGNAAGWWKNGVRKLGLNTDAPVVPQNELSYQGAMACWYGWLHYPALRGVTIIPAKALGIDDIVGSIEVGKDADFGIWTGSPIDPRSACMMTVINGKIAYDGTKKVRRF